MARHLDASSSSATFATCNLRAYNHISRSSYNGSDWNSSRVMSTIYKRSTSMADRVESVRQQHGTLVWLPFFISGWCNIPKPSNFIFHFSPVTCDLVRDETFGGSYMETKVLVQEAVVIISTTGAVGFQKNPDPCVVIELLTYAKWMHARAVAHPACWAL